METKREWKHTIQNRQCTYKRHIGARSRNHRCRGKATSITYSECVCVSVALVIEQAARMRRIILSLVTCPAVPYFSTLSHKRHDFWKKKLLNIKCVFWFSLQLLSEIFLILRTIERYTVMNLHRSSCRVSVILVKLQWSLNFLDRSSKKYSNIKFHENPSSGSPAVPCGRTDVQTWRKLIFAFRNFANAPKNKT
jgi:hypothetical protein